VSVHLVAVTGLAGLLQRLPGLVDLRVQGRDERAHYPPHPCLKTSIISALNDFRN
jgi:hypothetical protein